MKYVPNGLYLDAGCGSGNLLLYSDKDKNIIGIDGSPDMLRLAAKKRADVNLFLSDLNKKLIFKDSAFNGIFSNNVIAFVDEPIFVIKEFYRVLKNGGKICLATQKESFNLLKLIIEHIKDSKIIDTLKTLIPLLILGIMNLKMLNDAKKKKSHYFSKDILLDLFKQAGFKNIFIESSYADQDWLVLAEK